MLLEAASCGIDHYLLGIVEPSSVPGVGLGSIVLEKVPSEGS